MAQLFAKSTTWGIRLAAGLLMLTLPGCFAEAEELGEGDLSEESAELNPATTADLPPAPIGITPVSKSSPVPVPVVVNETHLCSTTCSGGSTWSQKQCLPVGQDCVFMLPAAGQQCTFSDTIIGIC